MYILQHPSLMWYYCDFFVTLSIAWYLKYIYNRERIMLDLFKILCVIYNMSNNSINWNDVIKKEARGINDADLGEVQEVRQDKVITKAGVVDKEVYSIPTSLVERYDGHNLWFRVTKEEAESVYKIKD